MTPIQAYERYLVILQSNGITDKTQSSKFKFTLNYNKAQNEVQEWLIERKNEDDNRYLQKIKVLNKKISKVGQDSRSDHFKLEPDYFDLLDVIVYAGSGKCTNQRLFSKEVKGENLNLLLDDPFSVPSFKYRECFYIVSEDSVKIYREDFEINSAELSYYRYPKQIRLADENNPESEFIEIELEFDDKLTERIISLAASQHLLNNKDGNYQALKQEVLSKL